MSGEKNGAPAAVQSGRQADGQSAAYLRRVAVRTPPRNPLDEPPAAADSLARELAREACAELAARPDDFACHKFVLADLKPKLVRGAADLAAGSGEALFPRVLLKDLARDMPDFSCEGLYEKRVSLPSLAGLTVLGWLLGGMLSGFLNLFGMGGDILRVASVFAMFWFSQFLAGNAGARNTLLACLGLGGLLRFASSAMGGFVRLASPGALRQAIFGSARLPNVFKLSWLLFGSFLVFVFLSKRITSVNVRAFEPLLTRQLEERINLALLALSAAGGAGRGEPGGKCPKSDCGLARATLELLGALPPAAAAHLAEKLREAGYRPADSGETLVWDPARHAALYDTVGLVRPGDRCRILSPACMAQGRVVRGHVQRLA